MVNKQVEELQAEIASLKQHIQSLETALTSHELDVLRFRALFNQSNDAIFLLDTDGIHIACNRRAANMLGYSSSDDMIGLSFREVVHTDAQADSEAKLGRMLVGETIAPYERIFRTKDGQLLPVEVNVEVIGDQNGNPLYIQSIVRDISERKQVEAALRASESRYRQMFERNEAVKLLLNPETGDIVDANPAAARFYGYTRETMQQMKITDINILPPEQVANDLQLARQQQRNFFLFQHRLANGDMRDVEVTSCPIDGEEGVLLYSIIKDVTDRSRAFKLIQESEVRYRQLFEDVPVALWEEDFSGVKALIDDLKAQGIIDFDAYFDAYPDVLNDCARKVLVLDVNQAALDLFSVQDKAEVVGTRLFDTMSEDGYQPFKQELVALINNEHTLRLETPIRTAHNENHYASLGWTIAPGNEETWERVLVSITDISDLKQAQDALRENEARYRMLFHIAPVALMIEDFSYVKTRTDQLTAQGVINLRDYIMTHPDFVRECAASVTVTEVNSRAVEMYGAQDRSTLEIPLSELFVDDNYEAFANHLMAMVAGGYDYQFETVLRRFDGEVRSVWLRRMILPGAESNWSQVLIMMIDITGRKASEQHRIELGIERERGNMLRHFIGGASHDIRTPLATMNTSLYLLRHGGGEPERNQRHLDTLDHQIQSLNRIIDDMLLMSRLDDTSQMEFTSVNGVSMIHTLLERYEAEIQAKRHTIHVDHAANIAPIHAAELYLSRALGNIITNAIDYTPTGGTIHIRIEQHDGHVVVAVQDNGIGIAEDALPHIFDPFYRADKARQRGEGHAGLGLTLAKKIIDLHEGTINVESEPDTGSTFIVTLPVAPVVAR